MRRPLSRRRQQVNSHLIAALACWQCAVVTIPVDELSRREMGMALQNHMLPKSRFRSKEFGSAARERVNQKTHLSAKDTCSETFDLQR